MARLNGRQIRQLQKVILDAFSSPDDFSQVLQFDLDKPLVHISLGRTNLPAVVLDVITAAESEGWTGDLLEAVAAERPALKKLQDTCKELRAVVESPEPQGKDALPIPTGERRVLEMAYLRRVQETANPLPLAVIDPRAMERNRQQTMDLLRVYIALNTDTPVPVKEEEADRKRSGRPSDAMFGERAMRPLSALEAAARDRQIVLLGDPGSGKSTFLNYLALCLAGARLEQAGESGNMPGDGWLKQLEPSWEHGALLPVHVVLRRFARTNWCDGTAEGLWNYVREALVGGSLEDFAPCLRQQLLEGGVLLLFDGLDEVTDPDQQIIVRQAVADFAATYSHPANRFLVTCRIYAYQDEHSRLDHYVVHRLAPLTEDQSDAFIESWYREVCRLGWKDDREATELTQKLKEATRRPDLAPLASNPLQLTMMASLHYSRGRLPDDRVDLYREMVELLLVRWQEGRLGEETGISQDIKLGDLRTALERVAFEVHRRQGGGQGAADIGETVLLSVLKDYQGGSWDRAVTLVTYIQERAGLLIQRGPGVYTFPHRSYQEYLAGAYLARQSDFPDQTVDLLRENYGQWREVALWAVSVMAREMRLPYIVMAVVAALCPDDLRAVSAADAEWRLAALAGEALLEAGLDFAESKPQYRSALTRVRMSLAGLVEKGLLTPVERARAGQTLARLGDPREGVGVKNGRPDILWSDPIPAGPFKMGEGSDEHTEKSITEPYRISVYPITNAQYDAFVQDEGYTKRWKHCWTAAGWQWKKDSIGPRKYGGVLDLSNHPVVGITWYEAVAFCNWLSENGDRKIELPTEAQWERAARSLDGRQYPWNGDITPDHANYGGNVGTTTAAGIYSLGAAECGVLDMSGNVWEWCRTKWRENYKTAPDDNLGGDAPRVLRGGSFYSNERYARCAFRTFGFAPLGRFDYRGFRVALSPGPLDSENSDL